MTLIESIEFISKSLSLPKHQVAKIVKEFVKLIDKSLLEKDTFKIYGLGSFIVKKYPPRKYFGGKRSVDWRYKVKFKPSRRLYGKIGSSPTKT